jgi:hypothetical protein
VISNIEKMQRHSQAIITRFEKTDRLEENPIHRKVCFLFSELDLSRWQSAISQVIWSRWTIPRPLEFAE